VLTAAYNFSDNAASFGHKPIEQRLRDAPATVAGAVYDRIHARGVTSQFRT
jgi:hypothetical protein